MPEPTPVRPKLRIAEILVRRNKLWGYTIIGAKVVDAQDRAVTPENGVTVEMALVQGLRRVLSGKLPFYKRGGYFIWRLDLRKYLLKSGEAALAVQAKLDGVTAAAALEEVRL
jgi:hypothetical protein